MEALFTVERCTLDTFRINVRQVTRSSLANEFLSPRSLPFSLCTFAAKPIHQSLPPSIHAGPGGYLQACPLGVAVNPIQVRTPCKKIFTSAAMAARTGLPEGIVQVLP